MSYGAKLFTETGQLAYSTDYPVYQFIGKFTFGTYMTEVNVISSHTPIVFVKPYNNGSSTETVSHSIGLNSIGPNIWTIKADTSANYTINRINSSSGYGTFLQNNNLPIEVLVFVRPTNQDAGTGYGMNVYDADGNISFTSTLKPLKISAYHDTNAESASYSGGQNQPTYLVETLTYGTIPTNWAASVADLGYNRSAIVSSSYWTGSGNQGQIWERIGAGKGSNSTTVNFDEAGYYGYVPPGVPGQYPSYAKIGGRRLLFLDHSSYNTPAYDNTNWAPNISNSAMTVPYNCTNFKIAGATATYNNSPVPTSAIVYSGPVVANTTTPSGSITDDNGVLRYTAASGFSGYVHLRLRAFYNGRPSGYRLCTITVGDSNIDISNSATLPSGTLGVPYSVQLNGTGGVTPYTFFTEEPALGYPLPPGLSVSYGGLISGTPTQRGTYQVKIHLKDESSISRSGASPYYINAKLFTLTIN